MSLLPLTRPGSPETVRTDLEQVLLDLESAVYRSQNFDQQAILNSIGPALKATAADVWLRPGADEAFTRWASYAAGTGTSQAAGALAESPVWSGPLQVSADAGFASPDRAVLEVPLLHRGEVAGVLRLERAAADAWTAAERVFAVAVADRIASVGQWREICGAGSVPQLGNGRHLDRGGQEQFLDLVQGLDAIIWEMDVRTLSFTFVSQRAEQLLGYPIQQWLEEPGFWENRLLHPDDRAWALEFCTNATRDAQDHEFEYRTVRSDGDVVWLRDLVRVVRDEHGTATLLRGVMIDISKEKRATERLQEREAQLAEAQAIAGLGSWEWDVEADRISWSHEQFRLHGRDPLPHVDFAWFFSHIHPEDQGWMTQRMEHTLATGQSFEFPYRIVRPDGELRWLHARGKMAISPEGRPLRMIGTSRDVTNQYLADAALRASEESYRTIFELSNDAMFVHDIASGAVLDANRRAAEMTGLPVEEMKQRGLEVLTKGPLPYTRGRAMEYIRGAAGGEPQSFEWLTQGPDGEELWTEVRIHRVTVGGVDRLLATARDIRERKEAEAALRASEEAYRTIFHNSSDAVWLRDMETGALLDVNERACELYGYTAEEMMSRKVGDMSQLFPPYTVERAQEYVNRAIAGEPQRFEWPGRHKDGSTVWAEIALRRVNIRGKDRLLATGRDINDRKAAEEELRQTERRANDTAERMRAVAHAAAGVIGADSVASLVSVLREACQRVIAFDTFAFALYDATDHTFSFTEGCDSDVFVPADAISAANTPGERVVRERRSLVTLRSDDPEAAGAIPMGTGRRSESVIRTPVLGGERVLGVLSVQSYTPELYTTADVEVLEAIASLAATALLNIELLAERRVTADALRRANEELEARVAERTIELAATNEVLEEEIAEHEAAREQLLERTAELEAIFQALPDLYFRLEHSGMILDYRSGSSDPFFTLREHVIGHRMQDVLPVELRGTLQSALDAVVRTADLVCVEDVISLPGAERDFEARLLPLAGDQVIMVVRDISERKQNERELQRRQEEAERTADALRRQALVFATLHEAVLVTDPQGLIIDWNPAAERMFGYAWEEVAGRSPTMLHDPALGGRLEAEIIEAVDRDGRWIGEMPFVRKDGSTGVSEVVVVAQLDDSGRRVAHIGVNRDVTDRKRAERALQEREVLFRGLIENAHDITVICDEQGRLVYVSPSYQRLLGYAPEEVIGTNAFNYFHPDDVGRSAAVFSSVVARPGSVGSSQQRFRHKDGSWRSLEAFARALSPDSAHDGIVVNVRDVTERVAAEQALRESEARYRTLIEQLPAVIYIASIEEGNPTLFTSPQAERLLGFSEEEWRQSPQLWLDRIHPEDRPHVEEEWKAAHAQGRSFAAEYRLLTRDGEALWFRDEAVVLRSEDGAPLYIQGVMLDVTERRQAEEALRHTMVEAEDAREAAERANRAKSEFLSRMSHELRTPMNSILGFAQLLGRAELPPEQRKSVQHILKAGRHLLTLINEVLEIARIEAGRQNCSLEPVRIGAVLQEAIGLVRPVAAQWGVELEGGPWLYGDRFVRADRQRLVQVLLNLLSNAIKYNRSGGSVRLACSPQLSGGDRPGFSVRVIDTGRGIPADRLDQLFTPFARLGAEQTEVEGTGLGLALSQRLVEAMGGALVLEETGAEGSVFRLDLAAAEDPVAGLEEASSLMEGSLSAPHREARILYVEDNLANLSLVETILLSRPRWRAVPALQGQLGVELAREHLPDLVLLDLHLPDIPGEEVLRRLRADKRTATIPVIVISADATRASIDRLRDAGADAYLTKPLDVDEFLSVVDHFLQEQRG